MVADAIPDAQYERLPDSEHASVKKNAATAAMIMSEEAGGVDIKIRLLAHGRVIQTLVYPPVTLTARGTVHLGTLPRDPGQPAPALDVDADGDGVYEATLQPIAVLDEQASADTAYPMLAVAPPAVQGGSVTVRWAAADALSGLQFEQATLDPGSATPQLVANGAMVALAPGQHTLEVLAQDRAGNTAVETVSFTVGGSSTVYLPLQQR